MQSDRTTVLFSMSDDVWEPEGMEELLADQAVRLGRASQGDVAAPAVRLACYVALKGQVTALESLVPGAHVGPFLWILFRGPPPSQGVLLDLWSGQQGIGNAPPTPA